MYVSVLGTGHLGATHAACLAAWGHDVIGIDNDHTTISTLASGRAPFRELDLDDLLDDGISSGRLQFDTDLAKACGAQVHFVCVGTPQADGGQAADLSAIWTLISRLGPLLERPCVVAGKSTVPVGTARRIRQQLQQAAPANSAVEVAWNPEFLREGCAVADSLHPDRVVVGVENETVQMSLRELYSPLLATGTPYIVTDLATAELAKVAANTMLAARLSLVNLLAEVCEAGKANVADLVTILGHDSRIGSEFMAPGLGFGGGCLPKDIRAFAARAEELGVGPSTRLVHEIDDVNMRQRERVVDKARELVGGDLEGVKMGLLGAAFKAGCDDVRDSPALHVAARLHDLGADVVVHDPAALSNAARAQPQLRYDSDILRACHDACLVILLTDWQEYNALDPVSLAEIVRHPRILDARLTLDESKWRAAGWEVRVLGR